MKNSTYLRYGFYAFFLGIGVGDLCGTEGIWFLLAIILLFCFGIFFFNDWKITKLILVVGFFLIVGILRLLITIPLFEVNDIGYYNDINEKIFFTGRISMSPEMRNNAQYLLVDAESVTFLDKQISVNGRVSVKVKPYPKFEYAQMVSVYGSLQKPVDFEGFSYKEYLAKDQIYSVIYNPVVKIEKESGFDFFSLIYLLKNHIKMRAETFIKEPGASIVIGLLIGARASIPQNILDDFQNTGLTHILAISGYNITLIINIFALLMNGTGRRSRFWITSLMIFVFAVLTGLSASVVRASIMGVLVILATHLGRKGGGMQVLLFSGVLMVAVNPFILVRDISFQLSYMSTMGLLLLLPLIEDFFKKFPSLISESLAVTLAATVFTTPIVLYNFERFSLISPLANVVFLPFIPLIMIFSFVMIVSSVFFSPLALLFSGICWVLITLLLEGVKMVAKIPFAIVEIPGFTGWMYIAYYVILLSLISFFRKSKLERSCLLGRFQF